MTWFFQVKLLIFFKLLTCRDQSNWTVFSSVCSSKRLHLLDVERVVDLWACWHRFSSNFWCETLVTYFSNVWSRILIFRYVLRNSFNEWDNKDSTRCTTCSKLNLSWRFYYFRLFRRRKASLWFHFRRCQCFLIDMLILAKFFFFV